MSDLLDLAVRAHGGVARWQEIGGFEARLSITGAIWHLKGRPDVLRNIRMRVDAHEERVETTFLDEDTWTTFEPQRVVVARHGGAKVETWDDPEDSFRGQEVDTPWEDVHVAYFSGEALWTYLNVPFIYTRDDFASEEVDSIEVDGERCRRLKVIFPDTVKSHTREQFSCFGPDGLLRRHDYTVDILGGATGLNYATDYRNVGGLVIPTTRRIYGHDGDFRPILEPLLVGIDIAEVTLVPRAL